MFAIDFQSKIKITWFIVNVKVLISKLHKYIFNKMLRNEWK